MKPGVSIKARTYGFFGQKNIYHLTPETEFDLLEIKLTTGQTNISPSLLDTHEGKDGVIYSFQKSLDDALLKRKPRLKKKSRLMKIKNNNIIFNRNWIWSGK